MTNIQMTQDSLRDTQETIERLKGQIAEINAAAVRAAMTGGDGMNPGLSFAHAAIEISRLTGGAEPTRKQPACWNT